MNLKLVSAFAAGAVIASGIVYFAVTPEEVEKSQPPRAHVIPAPKAAVERPNSIAKIHAPLYHAPVREKPSPMSPSRPMPPVRQDEPVVIARNDPPPPPAPVVQTAPPSLPAENMPTPVPVENVSLPAPQVDVRVPHTVTLTAGTLLPVRIGETLSSAHNQQGDSFLATLTQPLVIDGFVIAERGARVEGRIVDSAQAGRVRGPSHLSISIIRVATSDGQNIRIRTEPYVKSAPSSTGTDAAAIGGGAALGAVIGAIAGGGKGAAIGAGVGGVAGAGGVLLMHGAPAEIAVETRVSFRVQDPVLITEHLD